MSAAGLLFIVIVVLTLASIVSMSVCVVSVKRGREGKGGGKGSHLCHLFVVCFQEEKSTAIPTPSPASG